MAKQLILFLLFAGLAITGGQGQVPATGDSSKLPSVEECIPASVSNLGTPSVFAFHNGLVTAVSAASDKAQVHTVQGLNHLHGGWEFEAMRHFAVAMKEDPHCLMAHWGMIISMLSPSPETDACRIAATTRMLQLIDDGEGTELERGYAYGLVKYIQEGPKGAADAFRKVADKFPGELQSEIFSALFSRTGYDEFGSITPDQEAAENSLLKLVERAPESALPLHTLLLVRAEGPDLKPSLELARKLCQLVPDYAPYFHLLGHYEWRCGEHAKAASAFNRAATLYSGWMKENGVTPADCDGWVRAECYRVVAMASDGEFDNAIASAEKLAGTTLNQSRPSAPGTRQLLWNAKTLPARILLRRSRPGDSTKALASLPPPAESAPFREKSLAHWWIDGLRIALDAQHLLDTGETEAARKSIEALTFHGTEMVKLQDIAAISGEQAEWLHSFRALEVLAAELRGRLALAGPPAGHRSAFNWFRAAADRQKPATMLNPPLILAPMAMRLGDYFTASNQPHKAVRAYQEALLRFPGDAETTVRLGKALKLAEAAGPEPEEPE